MMYVLQLLYFFLPAYVANMMPVIGRKWLKPLAKPVNKKLFGEHKTWRGLILGTVGGIVTAGIQSLLNISSLNLAPYDNWALLGFLLGFGALLGDLLKSFFKRRVGIKPGHPWIPFDQLDFVIGGLALASFVYFPGWMGAILLAVSSFILHILVNHIGHWIGMRKVAW